MHRLESEAVPSALDGVHALLDAVETDELVRTRLAIAMAELVANVIEHGRTPQGRPPHFVLEVAGGPDAAVAELTDDGIGFPPEPREAEEMAESGRGIALVHDAADEVAYERRGECNHWRVLVRRTA